MFLSAFTANTSSTTALQFIVKNKTDEWDKKEVKTLGCRITIREANSLHYN